MHLVWTYMRSLDIYALVVVKIPQLDHWQRGRWVWKSSFYRIEIILKHSKNHIYPYCMPIYQWLFNSYNFSLLHIYTNNKKKLLVCTYKFTGDHAEATLFEANYSN